MLDEENKGLLIQWFLVSEPTDEVIDLLKNQDCSIQACVASLTRSTKVIESLAESRYWQVRQAIAYNYFLPDEVGNKLYDDEHIQVRFAIINSRILEGI